MHIRFSAGRFVAQSTYAEKDLLKGAGWRWDPAAKAWWTDRQASAARLLAHCDDSAKAELATHIAAVQASCAVTPLPEAVQLPVPAGLAYLPYQAAGIATALARRNVLIADEPGLGKTIQAIGVINADPSIARVLVVCPASLRLNWRREATKWLTRGLPVQVLTNGDAVDTTTPGITVISYERLVKRPDLQVAWDLVVVDEAHFVKNPKTKRSASVYAVAKLATRVMLLTGTPILNRPIELHPLLALLDTANWGNFWNYARRYCNAHKEWVTRSKEVWVMDGASNLGELQERLRSTVMVRRLKADVLTELPAKRRTVVELDVKHPDNAAIKGYLEGLRDAEVEADAWDEMGEGDMAHAARSNSKTGVSFEQLSAYRHELGLAKVPAVIEYVDTLREGGTDKVVIFAHHVDVIRQLVAHYGDAAVAVYGDVSAEDRQAAVDRFQGDDSCKVFVGSIMAAGVGFTLTAASTVVFAEIDWVPGNLVQAEDRCHRIGQRDMVQSHMLVVPNTLEAYMAEVVAAKAAVALTALDASTQLVSTAVEAPARNAAYTVAVELRQAVLVALRTLAAFCDGARSKDGTGFNKLDTAFGKKLASCQDLSDKQYAAGRNMVRKYRRQLPTDLVATILG